MTVPQLRLMEEVKSRLVLCVAGTNDIVEATGRTVALTFKEACKEEASSSDTVDGIARGCIRGVTQGGGDLGDAATGIVLGVMRGRAEATRPQIMEVIRHAAQIAIHETSAVGGNVGAAATGLITGAIVGAKEMDFDAEQAAGAAADGALKGARQVGSRTFAAVRLAVVRALPRRQARLDGIGRVPPP